MNKDKMMVRLSRIIIDDDKRKHFQARLIYLMLAAIAGVMSLINVFTAQWILLIATGVFCLLCLLNFFLDRLSVTAGKVASDMFVGEIIALFSYFVLTGGTAGFSIIWLLLLPTIGIFFFGFRKGSVISLTVLLITVLFFWLPGSHDRAVAIYGITFVTRFPVVYACSYLLSLMLETVRFITARELTQIRVNYEHLYNHDALTGAYNRHAVPKRLQMIQDAGCYHVGAMILDIDHFKEVNDTYGHMDGDAVLRQLTGIVSENIPRDATLFRWGGEEFAVLFPDAVKAGETAEKVLHAVREKTFTLSHQDIHITVSIGLATTDNCHSTGDFDRLMLIADDCLYQAKRAGRDRLITKEVGLLD